MADQFRLLGGHTALDFVNTVGGRTHATGSRYEVERERIESIEDLYEWASIAGLVTAAERRRLADAARSHPRSAAAVLERARRLREALYTLFRGGRRGLDELNDELANARTHERVEVTGGRPRIVWDDGDALDRPLWEVARAAAALMTGDELSRVKQCGGESCGWLFLDTSRNRSRQWCDMADCGNIAKVRRFRERSRGG